MGISSFLITENKQYLSVSRVVLIVLAFILTFPVFDYSYGWGIDPSLKFLFHHILEKDFSMARELIFPYGPLTFLMFPLFSNPLPAIFTRLALHLVLLIIVFRLARPVRIKDLILPFIVSFIILWLSTFHGLLSMVIAVFFLLALAEERQVFAIGAFFFASLAVYIKINAAVMAGLFCLSYLLIHLYRTRDTRKFFLLVSIQFGFLLIFWLVMFGGLKGIVPYFIGLINLAGGNGSGASLYPENNPAFLLLFAVIILGYPFLNRSRRSDDFSLLFFLPLFAAWKHGFGRQDPGHNWVFIVFCFSMTGIYIIYSGLKLKWITLALPAALVFLILNFRVSFSWANPLEYNSGIQNLSNIISNYRKDLAMASSESALNVIRDHLPDSALNLIGDHTVDIYPWDYGYLAANRINWQPRPEIQAFLSYTRWIEEQNVNHFLSEKAPEFLLWHISKVQSGINRGEMYGIDNRYILNEEPVLIETLVSRYRPVLFHPGFTLYRKRSENLNYYSESLEKAETKWDTWVPVPEANELTRLKIQVRKNLIGILKSFFFKDEKYVIYTKNSRGVVSSMRFIPSRAVSGLWINPMILDPFHSQEDDSIKFIMLKCSGGKTVRKSISYEFEKVCLEGKVNGFAGFFLSGNPVIDSLVIFSENRIDTADGFWNIENLKRKPDPSDPDNLQNLIEPGQYSSTFRMEIEPGFQGTLEIRANVWVIVNHWPDSQFVISLAKDGKSKVWKYVHLSEQVLDKKNPNVINNKVRLDVKPGEYDELKVFIVNNGKADVYADDFRVEVWKIMGL